jgi:type II secretory pathway component PulF
LGAFVSPLLSVAESTGNLGPLLQQISTIYEKMSTTQQERLIPLIEPVCLLVLGALLVFVVWGTLVPLYDHVLTQPLPV